MARVHSTHVLADCDPGLLGLDAVLLLALEGLVARPVDDRLVQEARGDLAGSLAAGGLEPVDEFQALSPTVLVHLPEIKRMMLFKLGLNSNS